MITNHTAALNSIATEKRNLYCHTRRRKRFLVPENLNVILAALEVEGLKN